jgi:hypothetical protein
MCKHIIMKCKINEPLFTAPSAFRVSSFLLSFFNHHVLINLTSISIHLCINKNHELCCGLSYNLFHEILLVSFIHTRWKLEQPKVFISSVDFQLWRKSSDCRKMYVRPFNVIEIRWSWAMIIPSRVQIPPRKHVLCFWGSAMRFLPRKLMKNFFFSRYEKSPQNKMPHRLEH